MYYAEWKRFSRPYSTFFAWLDKDREATIPQCTRLELENDTVEYLSTDEQRRRFMVTLCDNHVYSTDLKEPITTGNDGWIFVVSRIYPPIAAHKLLLDSLSICHRSGMELCLQQQKELLHPGFITVVSLAGRLSTVQELLYQTKVMWAGFLSESLQ